MKKCDICKKEIDPKVTNSVTIEGGGKKFTVCEDCGRRRSQGIVV